jgi:hypothetical protein
MNHEKEKFVSHVQKQLMKESFAEMSSIDNVLQSGIDLTDFSNWLNNQFIREMWVRPWAIAIPSFFRDYLVRCRSPIFFDCFASPTDAERAKISIDLKAYRINLPSNNITFNRKIARNHFLSQVIDEHRGWVSCCIHIRGFQQNNTRIQI